MYKTPISKTSLDGVLKNSYKGISWMYSFCVCHHMLLHMTTYADNKNPESGLFLWYRKVLIFLENVYHTQIFEYLPFSHFLLLILAEFVQICLLRTLCSWSFSLFQAQKYKVLYSLSILAQTSRRSVLKLCFYSIFVETKKYELKRQCKKLKFENF